jgi:hypothetical protein
MNKKLLIIFSIISLVAILSFSNFVIADVDESESYHDVLYTRNISASSGSIIRVLSPTLYTNQLRPHSVWVNHGSFIHIPDNMGSVSIGQSYGGIEMTGLNKIRQIFAGFQNTQISGKPDEPTFFNAGNVGIGIGNPQSRLHVMGNVSAQGFCFADEFGEEYSNCINAWPEGASGGESLWTQASNRNNIYREAGNVGIGTNNPQESLDVAGDLRFTGNNRQIKIFGGSSNSQLNIDFNTNANADVNFFKNSEITGDKGVNFYGDSTNVDVRIGVDGGNTFFNSGNVGIGTGNPQSRLHVQGNILGSSMLTLQGNKIDLTGGATALISTTQNQPLIFRTNTAPRLSILANGGVKIHSGDLTLDVNKEIKSSQTNSPSISFDSNNNVVITIP